MLQSMRQLAHSWVVKGLMLFLIISFSVWGIGDIFRGNPLHSTVAKAGNTDISVEMLNHAFEQALAKTRQSLYPNLTAQEAKKRGVLDRALDGEINRTLIEQDVKRLNLDVPQESVLKMLGEQPQFRTKEGSFNKDLFRTYLQQQGLNEVNFVAKAQQDMAREILLDTLNDDRFVPQAEIDALYKARAQKHTLDVVTIDASKISDIPAPDDKALHDFYDHNPQPFTAPEYRALTIASLSTDALAKDITITDDQVKKEYDDKGDELANPEQRDIVQVVVQDEDRAKQLASQARMSKDLSATAKINHETAVPLTKMEEKDLLPELSKTVFALKSGEVCDPVKTQLGWHVVQVKDIIPAGKPSFDKIKDSLRDDMRRDQAVEAATRTVNQLDDQLAAGHSLDDIADSLKLRLVKIQGVDSTGIGTDGKEPAEFPNKDAALKAAFAQNAGETSPIEDDKEGNYYVVRTDDVTPAAVRPFDQVKDSVIKAWKSYEQLGKAQAEAAKIDKELSSGKALSAFDGQQGVSTRTSTPISALGDTDALLPADIVAQSLRLKKGETAVGNAGSKVIVVRVASIADADLSTTDPRKNMIGMQVKQHRGEEIFDQYLNHLHDVFPVKIDHELLAHLQQQDN